MSISNLGRLEPVPLRKVWDNEATAFTPWLAKPENLKLLGETIDIELELEAQEKEVGVFRADILCKDINNDHWVLIENQLARTDHSHLGQLLTYAAGLQAVTIVWIAEAFTEQHRAALSWLNEITDKRFSFFGLEVELWRIGDSEPAPKFNVICKPNDWSKSVSEAALQIEQGELTDAKRLQLEFWQQFSEYARANAKCFKATKAFPQHWMNIALGRSGFHLSGIASFYDSAVGSYDDHELRVELVLDGNNSKFAFQELERQKTNIERELGQLTWHNPPEKRMCRVYTRQTADLEDRNRWPEYFGWLVAKLDAFHQSFAPRVRIISYPVPEEGRDE